MTPLPWWEGEMEAERAWEEAARRLEDLVKQLSEAPDWAIARARSRLSAHLRWIAKEMILIIEAGWAGAGRRRGNLKRPKTPPPS